MRGATKCAFLIFICLAILLFGVGGMVMVIFMAWHGLLEVLVMPIWVRAITMICPKVKLAVVCQCQTY